MNTDYKMSDSDEQITRYGTIWLMQKGLNKQGIKMNMILLRCDNVCK